MTATSVINRFSKAAPTYEGEACVQNDMAQMLITKLQDKSFASVLEIGCGTGNLTNKILTSLKPRTLTANDLSAGMLKLWSCKFLKDKSDCTLSCVQGDAECISFKDQYDLIVSNATFQWFEHLDKTLLKLKLNLKENGVLAFSTFGPDNFKEIKDIAGVGLEYQSVDSLKKVLAECGFDASFTSTRITTHFKDVKSLLQHFKNTGVSGLGGQVWTKSKLISFIKNYEQKYSSKAGVSLTWEPIYVVASVKR